MQLAVDIGNSRVKCALFKGKELISDVASENEAVYVIKEIVEGHNDISAIILSSVRSSVDAETIPIPETIHHVILDHETPLPFRNLYGSPESLGRDRIAAVAGAISEFPGRNLLVVDAGTCLTMDLVTEKGEYIGGSISPGLKMRLRSMHEGTAKLPLVEFNGEKVDLIGKSTEECLKSGAVNGLLNELKGTIMALERQFEHLQVVITGGDVKLFDNELKSGIFADPKLVLRGLNEILLYNIENQ